jgi:protein subunit release factor A
MKYAANNKLKAELLDSSDGHLVAKISGPNAGKAFQHEAGKHCVQRIPPTETKGRKQTSYVSVGVLPLRPEKEYQPIPASDLDETFQVGSGPGGQHRNKTASTVRLRHIPTGLQVYIDGRDQSSNRRTALRILTAKVNEAKWAEIDEQYNAERKKLLGNGGRGEKVRTYNFLESRAVDHRLGTKTAQVKQVMKGQFELLFPKDKEVEMPAVVENCVRLACMFCDEGRYDCITPERLEELKQQGWKDIEEVQSYEDSIREFTIEEVDASGNEKSVLDWYTHCGVCPECAVANNW